MYKYEMFRQPPKDFSRYTNRWLINVYVYEEDNIVLVAGFNSDCCIFAGNNS